MNTSGIDRVAEKLENKGFTGSHFSKIRASDLPLLELLERGDQLGVTEILDESMQTVGDSVNMTLDQTIFDVDLNK